MINKIKIEDEIQGIGKLYRMSDVKEARDCYDQYINLIILEEPEYKRGKLEEMWKNEK